VQTSQRAREAVTDAVLSSLSARGNRFATEVHCQIHISQLVDQVLETFLAGVGGDAAGLWEHVRGGWSTPLFVTPTDVWRRLPYGKTVTSDAAKIHPGVRHCLEMHPTAPFTITDLVTDRVWDTSAIGRSMRAEWGRNFQLMVPIDTASPTFWVWVIGRQRVDFGDEDRQVAAALQPVLTAVSRHFAEIQRARPPEARADSLTPRESTVLCLLTDGRAPAEIAARLSISPRTVAKHIERIYRKFGVHDRLSLFASLER